MTFPIVGARFRPPSKPLLQVLPMSQPLSIRPEPDNPYDPNAVAVWCFTADLPSDPAIYQEFDTIAAPYGFSWEDIDQQEEWQLGYVPRDMTKDILPFLRPGHNPAILDFDSVGNPRVRVPKVDPETARQSEVE